MSIKNPKYAIQVVDLVHESHFIRYYVIPKCYLLKTNYTKDKIYLHYCITMTVHVCSQLRLFGLSLGHWCS